MGPGQQRKRMLKLARRVPVQEVEEFVLRQPGSHPSYFVLREYGFELLRGWHNRHGITEVSMEDDVFYLACCEYLKAQGFVFESTEAALQYARERGLFEMSK
jgi:hypothetical protein